MSEEKSPSGSGRLKKWPWRYPPTAKLERLLSEMGAHVEVDYRIVPVFGSVPWRFEHGPWAKEGVEGRIASTRRIAEQAERAGKVIKSVHDFVRRRDQAREPVAPQVLLDAIMPLVSLQARKLGVRVETRLAATLPAVLCDRTMVEQVLLNLARNAMQAMDDAAIAPRILDIRVRRGASNAYSSWLEFSVTDCGVGIAPEVAQQLFTPFFTTRAEGMGLGLSMCRTVVEQHGGVLAYEPHAPRGTAFTFTLPVCQPASP